MMHGQSIRKGHHECFRNLVYFGLMILQDGRDALSMVISISFPCGSPGLLLESSRECVDDEMHSRWKRNVASRQRLRYQCQAL
jgi:hypothetical protein